MFPPNFSASRQPRVHRHQLVFAEDNTPSFKLPPPSPPPPPLFIFIASRILRGGLRNFKRYLMKKSGGVRHVFTSSHSAHPSFLAGPPKARPPAPPRPPALPAHRHQRPELILKASLSESSPARAADGDAPWGRLEKDGEMRCRRCGFGKNTFSRSCVASMERLSRKKRDFLPSEHQRVSNGRGWGGGVQLEDTAFEILAENTVNIVAILIV